MALSNQHSFNALAALQEYVQVRLAGQLQRPDGRTVAGPPTSFDS